MIALIVVGVVVVGLIAAGALLFPALTSARGAARRQACMNNLKQIGMATMNYNDVYRRFPAPYTADAARETGA